MSTPKTEADALAQLETANTALAAMTKERDTLNGSVAKLTTDLGAVTTERDSLKTERDTLNGKVTKLTADLGAVTTERDTLKSEKKDLATAVAAELAKHGIMPGAVTPPETTKDATGAASGEDGKLLAEYQAVAGDPKKLSALLNDPEKGPKLRKLASA